MVYVRPIRSDADHRTALERISTLMSAQPGTVEGDELVALAALVEDYERRFFDSGCTTLAASLVACRMIERALEEYFSYSPSRRDEKALGAVETARKRVRDVLPDPPAASRDHPTPVEENRKLAQRLRDVLAEYAEDDTREAVERCEHCHTLVLCSFHSVLSALSGRTTTNIELARDHPTPEEQD